MNEHINIVFIVSSLCFGGVEKGTVTRFNNLKNSKFRKGLVYLKRDDSLLLHVNKDSGLVWSPNFKRGLDFTGLRRLSAWLKNDFEPDVILCVNPYSLFYGFLAKMLSGSRAKLMVSFHSTTLSNRDSRWMKYFYRFFFNLSDQIIYVSTAQRSYWEDWGLSGKNARTIHNGVDTEYYRDQYSILEKLEVRARLGFTPGDFVIGICAALRVEKCHEDLIDAVARLRTAGISAKCMIIGDGPCREAITAKINAMKLDNDVAIIGFKSDVRPYIAACSCLTLVSHEVETFSNAALECMALGKPMVMSAIGGAAELVRSGENGYLFPAGNIDSLTLALGQLSDPERRAALGKQARATVVQEFGLDSMLKKYEQLFTAICKK